jgi:hypothetical protein
MPRIGESQCPAHAAGDSDPVLAALAAMQLSNTAQFAAITARVGRMETAVVNNTPPPVVEAPASTADQHAHHDAGNANTGNLISSESASRTRVAADPDMFGAGDGLSDEESFEDAPVSRRAHGRQETNPWKRPSHVDENRAPHRFDPDHNTTFRGLTGASAKEFSILYSALSYLHEFREQQRCLDDPQGVLRDSLCDLDDIIDILASRHDYVVIKQRDGEQTAAAIYDAHDAPSLGLITSSKMQKGYREYLRKVTTAQVNKASKLSTNNNGDRRSDKDRDGKRRGGDGKPGLAAPAKGAGGPPKGK